MVESTRPLATAFITPTKRRRSDSDDGGGGGGGGGGGAGVVGGAGRFDGMRIYYDHPTVVNMAASLQYRELLEPVGRLEGLMLVTG